MRHILEKLLVVNKLEDVKLANFDDKMKKVNESDFKFKVREQLTILKEKLKTMPNIVPNTKNFQKKGCLTNYDQNQPGMVLKAQIYLKNQENGIKI